VGLLHVEPLPGYEAEMGRCFWALEEARRRTLTLVEGVDQPTLDWEGPDGQEDAIGSLLYHIASSEMRWLFQDILQQDFPPSVNAAFRHKNGHGRMPRVLGVPLVDHLACLRRSREFLLETCRTMSLAEWRRSRRPANRQDYEVTPEWVIFHLVEHEAGHAFQISVLKARATRRFASRKRWDRATVSMKSHEK